MNINENFRNERKNPGKIKRGMYEHTNISPSMCSRLSNLLTNQCSDMIRLP